ncbi:MAG TPA: hypothetical protein VF362_02530 [Demequinaceae bacterium]
MTIAHRFALAAPGGWQIPGATAWDARDTRLDVPVTVLVADSGDPESILAVLTRARGVRDPRLARIVDVGIADVPAGGEGAEGDDAATERRAYVAVANPPSPTALAILESRILPASLARLLIRGAADALDAARAGGLDHGALSPGAIGVTSRGRVIVAGAGLLSAFGGDARGATAADSRALATLFARAVLGLGDTADEDAREQDGAATLPDDLTKTERRLVKHALRGQFPSTVDELLAALGAADGATLSAIRTQLRKCAPVLVPEVVELEPEGLERAETREGAAYGAEAPPAGATREEIEEWELEHLLEEEEAEEIPTLAEAILDLLHRRFPRSIRITRYLEAAHARALRGPKVNGTAWTLVALLLLLTILVFIAVDVYQRPFVPTFDLHNQPAHSYPSFTFGPSPTAVTPAP